MVKGVLGEFQDDYSYPQGIEEQTQAGATKSLVTWI